MYDLGTRVHSIGHPSLPTLVEVDSNANHRIGRFGCFLEGLRIPALELNQAGRMELACPRGILDSQYGDDVWGVHPQAGGSFRIEACQGVHEAAGRIDHLG